MFTFINYNKFSLLLAVVCIPLMSCSASKSNVKPQPIKPSNDGTSNYTVKISKEIPNSQFGVVVEHQAIMGDGKQYLPADNYYEVNSNPYLTYLTDKILISRPSDTVQVDYSLTTTSLSGKWNVLNFQRFVLNFYAGLSNVQSKIDTIGSRGFTQRNDYHHTQLLGKVELSVPITHKLRITGAASEAVGRGFDHSLLTETLSFNYQVSKLIQLTAGYQYVQYDVSSDYEPNETSYQITPNSAIHLHQQGFLAGIAFTF